MKTLQITICLALWIINVHAQDFKIINSKDLIRVADKYGIDSALVLSRGFPIYSIDTLTAITLLSHVFDYKRYSRTETFFNDMAQNWEQKFLKEKTAQLLYNEIEKIKLRRKDNYGNLIIFDDKLITSILKQKPDSSEELLINGYLICSHISDSLKAIYPSAFSRYFKSVISGTHPTVEAYLDYQLNCYKLMWTLGQIKSLFFDSEKLNYHLSQLRKWEQDRILNNEMYNGIKNNFQSKSYKNYSQIFNLKKSYESLSSIDYENETDLISIMSDFEAKDKCWNESNLFKPVRLSVISEIDAMRLFRFKGCIDAMRIYVRYSQFSENKAFP